MSGWGFRYGSDSAVAVTLAARPVYPRKLTTLLQRPRRQPRAKFRRHVRRLSVLADRPPALLPGQDKNGDKGRPDPPKKATAAVDEPLGARNGTRSDGA